MYPVNFVFKKHLGLLGCCLLLDGCALLDGGTTFSGESTTFGGNNALRNDVLRNIKIVDGCTRIDSVHAEIKNIRTKGELKIEDLWTVQGCGGHRSHPVTLYPVYGGGTMINISVPPKRKSKP